MKRTTNKYWVIGGMIVLLTVGFVLDLTEHNPSSVSIESISPATSLKVGALKPGQLMSHVLSRDIPPNGSTASPQTAGSTPEQSSSQTLQSNVNINSPAYANDPLVQSLQYGGQ